MKLTPVLRKKWLVKLITDDGAKIIVSPIEIRAALQYALASCKQIKNWFLFCSIF